MTLSVRDLQRDDLGQLAWTGSPTHLCAVANVLDHVAAGDAGLLAVCNDDGVIIGVGAIDYAIAAPRAKFWQIVVREDQRSQGTGSVLMRALEEESRAHGCAEVVLSVEIENVRGLAFYKKLGYVQIGRSTERWMDEIDGNNVEYVANCIVMSKSL